MDRGKGRDRDERARSERAPAGDGRRPIPPPPDLDGETLPDPQAAVSGGAPAEERHEHRPVEVERIERVDDERPPRSKGSGASSRSGPRKRTRPRDIDASGVNFGGIAPSTAKKMERRLVEAATAFEHERFTEAEQLLSSIERLAPGVVEVAELRGLTYYRLGQWIKAINQFEAFHQMTGSVEQHPVWADCCRALGRWNQAEALWHELGEASPSAELVEEGRLVQAGGLADRGRLADAIRLLEQAPTPPRKPGLHHLRRWYVLGDLYERSGDLARARRVFGQLVDAEPGFGDAAERLAGLG